jgi:hypothetical protein
MKVNEVVLIEVSDTYFDTLSDKLSAMGTRDAIVRGTQDSRVVSRAKDWLNKWNSILSQLKHLPNQTKLTSQLQQLVYRDMEIPPNDVAEKAIQQLVDLTTSKQTNTGIALRYMTKLMTLSLIRPKEEKNQVNYGGPLPPQMLQAGKVVPIKFVEANDSTHWVKFNGEWFKDIDSSSHQVKLNNEPAYDSAEKLDSMHGRDVPMRVGQTGSRTLEFLHKSETEDWFNEYE